MTSRKALTLAAAFGLLLSAADVRSAPQAPGLSAPAATSIRLGSIVGSAWNADNTGIAGAHLRLRNLSNGKIVSATVADQVGQFRFDTVAEGSYLIELVDDSAKVLAVGQMFSIAPGEAVATFVRFGYPCALVRRILQQRGHCGDRGGGERGRDRTGTRRPSRLAQAVRMSRINA